MSRPDGAADAAADSEPVHDDELTLEAEPETVTVEHEGQTYEVPAALQHALMRHEDYARKSQAVAQMRDALIAGHQDLAAEKEALAAHLGEHARLAGLDDGIARLSQLNWPVLQQQNPAQAQQLMTQLFQMKQAPPGLRRLQSANVNRPIFNPRCVARRGCSASPCTRSR